MKPPTHKATASQGNGKRSRTVILYPSRKPVEVEPGVRVAPVPNGEIPEIAIARWQPAGDGTYRPVLIIHEVDVRLRAASNILHVPYRTLLRLARAGFVKSVQPSPGFYQISLSSYFEHIRKLQEDPDFWLKESNRRKYREAL